MNRLFHDALSMTLAKLLGRRTQKDSPGIPLQSIAQFLPPDPVIIEAGAHVGIDTLAMSRFWPHGRIHAFEPVPRLYAQLQKRTSGIPNIHCYQVALGAAEGEAQLHVSSGDSDGSSSLLPPKEHIREHPDVFFQESIMVRTVSLDLWAEQAGIGSVDFLWLDLQGYESEVLCAAPRVLKTVRAIHTEVSLKEMYHGAPLYDELRRWLVGEGFAVVAEEMPWADMGNVLFVRKEYIP